MNRETNGNLIVRRMDEILIKRQDTRAGLSRALNLKQQMITNWIARGSMPKVEDAIRIAEYLNVSVEWLVYGEDPAGLSQEQRDLIADWNLLSDQEKQSVRILIDGFKKSKSQIQADSV